MQRESWRSHLLKRAAVMLPWACALAFSCAVASPKTVERFDASTWARMQEQLPRPAAVVFTATYCANCPVLIGHLAETLRQRGLLQRVVAVVIDAADNEELLKSEHYESASQLFAFDGDEARLRYGIDPRWRGVTPYVALLGTQSKVLFVAGTPSKAQIDAWLGANP